ncbi:LANO_0E07338g1_1 [Lachancea nothofagi CBS 11611]|uniref:adenosylmethionine decarboxylase n=1 Tax=Lachancea nothofagi CBS 11611 TaxID=1266666 RepID=A0A1G4JUH8_9SACH|nr:LANO_0E07338g1_1 [Lachancea nothofagi CBS 11611]
MTVSLNAIPSPSYIDRELSANLDSTDAFEGPEKLLEIWFYKNSSCVPDNAKTLRSIDFSTWVRLLQLVKCQVLSMKQTEKMNAFLLSESSLFVFDHKLTLKTCGTTTTLFCLEELFRVVKEHLDWNFCQKGKVNPYKVFYSRRCFMFPKKQQGIHQNWDDETQYLNKFFSNGKSYLVGRLGQANHWSLYVTETNRDLDGQDENFDGSEEDDDENDDDDDDETLEMLMTGLTPSRASQFVTTREPGQPVESDTDDEGHVLGAQVTEDTQLDRIYDNVEGVSFQQDAFAFTPCGYSANVVMDQEYYYTLHVTPEDGWSYASFESNVPVTKVSGGTQDNIAVMERVLQVFGPSDFCLTFFSRRSHNDNFAKLKKLTDRVSNYTRKDKIVYQLDDYHLLYLRFERNN